MFTQQHSLMMHFSEFVPTVKWHMTVLSDYSLFSPLSLRLKINCLSETSIWMSQTLKKRKANSWFLLHAKSCLFQVFPIPVTITFTWLLKPKNYSHYWFISHFLYIIPNPSLSPVNYTFKNIYFQLHRYIPLSKLIEMYA